MHRESMSPSELLTYGLLTIVVGSVLIVLRRPIGEFVEKYGRGNTTVALIIGIAAVFIGSTFVLGWLVSA